MKRERRVVESLGAIVLGFEFIIVGLGALVGFGLKVVNPPTLSLIGGGALALLLLIGIPLLRFNWGVWFVWVVQALIFASGFWVPMMFLAAAVFIAIWVYALVQARKVEILKRLHAESHAEQGEASEADSPI